MFRDESNLLAIIFSVLLRNRITVELGDNVLGSERNHFMELG